MNFVKSFAKFLALLILAVAIFSVSLHRFG